MAARKPLVYRFDPKKGLPDYGVLVYVGRTKSGKTFMMRDNLYHYRHSFDIVVVMSGSKETAIEFEQHIPALYIYDDLDLDKIKEIYESNEEKVAQEMRGYGVAPRILFIIDDLGFKKKNILASEVIGRIFFNCRHAKICMMISVQDCKLITPALRQQARLIFLAQEKNPQNRKRIFDAFNPCFKTFEEFDEVMKLCTNNFEQMVLENQLTGSYDICDNVFYYKASDHGRFKVNRGGKIWRHNKKNLDTKHAMRSKKKKTERKAKVTKAAGPLPI